LTKVWLTPISSEAYHAIQLVAGGAIAGICWLGQRRGWSRPRLMTTMLGLVTCWMTTLGPATEANTYIFVAPALAWCLMAGWIQNRSLSYRLTIGLSFAIFTVAQTAIWFPHVRDFHLLGPHPFAGLLLFIGLAATSVSDLSVAASAKDAEIPASKAA
jgi:hypothetical protein